MQPRNPGGRKSGPPGPGRDRRPRGLLSVRSARVLGFAVLTALGGPGLLYAAHRPVALVVLGAVGILAAALKLFDSMIELKPWPPVVSRSGRSRSCLASLDVTAVGRGRQPPGWRESAGLPETSETQVVWLITHYYVLARRPEVGQRRITRGPSPRSNSLRRRIGERGGAEQLLHGEPHPGNVLTTKNGPLFIDLETCCRGPVEFDLAHAPETVSEHYPGVNQDLLRECRILVLAMVATWRWDRGDQLPNGRQLGTEWLSQIRAALDRYRLDVRR